MPPFVWGKLVFEGEANYSQPVDPRTGRAKWQKECLICDLRSSLPYACSREGSKVPYASCCSKFFTYFHFTTVIGSIMTPFYGDRN
jgi:hypothetical protein